MSDAINIPQLTVVPTPAASRGEDARAVPEAPATTADAAPRSFAEVLKSKATPKAEPASDVPAEDVRPQFAQEDASLLAVISGIPVSTENPLAPQLLAQLKKDAPVAVQTDLPAVSAAAATIGTPAATAEQQLAALPAAAAAPAEPPVLAAPAIPLTMTALPTNRAAPAAPQALASAVPPAPTFASAKGPERSLTPPAPSASRSTAAMPEVLGDAPLKQALFAANAAISAEAGDMPDATAEFGPLPDRLTEHSGNIAPQTTASQATSQQNSAAPVQIRVATPFAQSGWAQEVDQKLTWMVTNTRQQADLVLNPPDLGRIEVTLVVKGDEVNASFASPHQAVREAIEESLVRLRESLAESGINLGQTHVGRDSSRDAPFMKQEGESRQGNGPRREAGIPLSMPLSSGTAWQPSRSRGMVDVFA
jgi:flagellar hook-length control protein FliK